MADVQPEHKVSAADTGFASLKIWKDANQNGISEASELTTLAQQNIASVNLQKSNLTFRLHS